MALEANNANNGEPNVAERNLGHVVLNVMSLARSVPFYRDVLGLREVARLGDREREIVGGAMAFFAFGGNHHDVALLEVAAAPVPAAGGGGVAGLAHLAIRIGDHRDQLVAFHQHLRALGVEVHHLRDHTVSLSIYLKDPDGILIEMYVDGDPQTWTADPAAVATVEPLVLD